MWAFWGGFVEGEVKKKDFTKNKSDDDKDQALESAKGEKNIEVKEDMII